MACFRNNKPMIKQLIKICHLDIYHAAMTGDTKLINHCIERDTLIDWDRALGGAAYFGSQRLVDEFIRRGAHDYQFAIYNAARGGHLELVKFFADKTKNYFWAFHAALRYGHISVVEYLINELKVDDDVNGLYYASIGGHIDLIKMFINRQSLNNALSAAAENGQLEAVKYIVDYANNNQLTLDLQSVFDNAVEECRTLVIEYLKSINNNLVVGYNYRIEMNKSRFLQFGMYTEVKDYNDALGMQNGPKLLTIFNMNRLKMCVDLAFELVKELNKRKIG
jgi:hypothetical protein